MRNTIERALTSSQLIRYQLILRQMSQRELARRIGCHEKTVSNVISGIRSTLWVRVAIARELGVDLMELWPAETRKQRGRNPKL